MYVHILHYYVFILKEFFPYSIFEPTTTCNRAIQGIPTSHIDEKLPKHISCEQHFDYYTY